MVLFFSKMGIGVPTTAITFISDYPHTAQCVQEYLTIIISGKPDYGTSNAAGLLSIYWVSVVYIVWEHGKKPSIISGVKADLNIGSVLDERHEALEAVGREPPMLPRKPGCLPIA